MYSDITEIREVNSETANALLKDGWKLLGIATVKKKTFRSAVNTRFALYGHDEFTPVYDEEENVVYIVGRPKAP